MPSLSSSSSSSSLLLLLSPLSSLASSNFWIGIGMERDRSTIRLAFAIVMYTMCNDVQCAMCNVQSISCQPTVSTNVELSMYLCWYLVLVSCSCSSNQSINQYQSINQSINQTDAQQALDTIWRCVEMSVLLDCCVMTSDSQDSGFRTQRVYGI